MDHKDYSAEKLCEFCQAPFYRDKRNTWAYWARARFCSATCSGRFQTAQAKDARPDELTVFRKWYVEEPGCWNWLGAKDRDGYGAFSYAGKTKRAHRQALILSGKMPKYRQMACHTCDNPSCVNPSHLYWGSPQDNSDDCVRRGRNARGERMGGSVLTDQAVLFIRQSVADDQQLAEKFGVTRAAINMARNRKTWRHLP